MAEIKKALIMAGGTGGHVFPGLAVAKALIEQGVEVRWLGTPNGIEARLVPENNIELIMVNVQGLRGNGIVRLLKAPWVLLKALWIILAQLTKFRPDVVIGFGGFVSGPGGVAAWLSKIPLVLHEQNAIPGLTNRILARLATRVAEAFPQSFDARFRASLTGNPVRADIASMPAPSDRNIGQRSPLRLLVLGGSLGAAAINDVVPRALAEMNTEMRPMVRHQAGARWGDQTREIYDSLGVVAEVVPFIDDMKEALAWADMVVCRAGALTVSELCAAGIGAILVPYPYAVDDHQTKNAGFMVRGDAAISVQQSDLTVPWLADRLQQWQETPSALLEMAESARALAKVDATTKVVELVEEAVVGFVASAKGQL